MTATSTSSVDAKIIDSAPIGIVVWHLVDPNDDSSLSLARANDAASKYVSQDLTKAVGRRFVDIFPLIAFERAKQYAHCARTEQRLDIEILSPASGVDRAYAISAVPMGDNKVILYFENIDAMRVAEASAKKANAFLDSVVEHLPLMLFVKEARELRFERINRAGEELLGVSREALLGKNDYDFFPTVQADFFVSADREVLRSRMELDIPEEPIQTANGERWLHTRKVPIYTDGEARYLIGISEDITERRLAARQLQAAKDAAEAASRELEAFSYSVAHDLRAPLRAIDGFSQALIEDHADSLDADGKAFLARVRGSAKRMAELIDDLLELSRVSRVELRRASVDLTSLAETTFAEHAETADGRTIEKVIHTKLEGPGDARLLRVVLDNLIGNAFKFTSRRDRARIEVGSTMHEGEVAYFVRDDGVGYDVTYANKLFSPFERLHSTTEFAGTGIGLAIVKRIIVRHGGRVWSEGEIDRGATFYFTLGEDLP